MNEQLITLSKVFTDRIFRIPDYQRGYAWTKKEVSEFWNDLTRLSNGKNHYVGVLTLEPVPEDAYAQWIDDVWLIEAKKYTPYYVVDGQQRLTTSILLIMAITNAMSIKGIEELNFTCARDIKKRFIFETKSENKSRSYLFGYEIANPSYRYLVNNIYNGNAASALSESTTKYTSNLKNALEFFETELKSYDASNLEAIYTKITQHFLFNTYEISSDIDVYVTFETMNNRGKPLSYLELLKNRLIYLSTLFDVKSEVKARLRRNINNCWKDIYDVIGRSKFDYLPDDEFLDAHFHIYFCRILDDIYKESSKRNYHFPNQFKIYDYLLDDYFVANKVSIGAIAPIDVFEYIESLERTISIWSIVNNPENTEYSDEVIEYLNKIIYLIRSMWTFNSRFPDLVRAHPAKVLLLSCVQKAKDEKTLLKFLKTYERFLFIKCLIPFDCLNRDRSMLNIQVEDYIVKLVQGEITVLGICDKIEKITNIVVNDEKVISELIEYYRDSGFYEEEFLPYFLCEYEVHLAKISRSGIEKIDRVSYFNSGYNSIEHIYPINSKHKYWLDMFSGFDDEQKESLKHSLGNFVALSKMKNARLANKPFPDKRDGRQSKACYRYGTYSEIELTEYSDWGPQEIKKRGLKLINFLQDRWRIKIGETSNDKIDFLGLPFMRKT